MEKNYSQQNLERRKDSFLDKVALAIHENPIVMRGISAALAGVAGFFTGGVGAIGVGALFALVEYGVEKFSDNRTQLIQDDLKQAELEARIEDFKRDYHGKNAQNAAIEAIEAMIESEQKIIEHAIKRGDKKGKIAALEKTLAELKKIDEDVIHESLEVKKNSPEACEIHTRHAQNEIARHPEIKHGDGNLHVQNEASRQRGVGGGAAPAA